MRRRVLVTPASAAISALTALGVFAGLTVGEGAAGAAEDAPVVTVKNIGLHIGGGPNDAKTKAPFLRALAGAFEAFAACGKLAPEGKRGGTFGIDLLVKKEGGHPETSNPRTAIPGDEFRACVVGAFAGVEFDRPRRGATKLSYALRFEPR